MIPNKSHKEAIKLVKKQPTILKQNLSTKLLIGFGLSLATIGVGTLWVTYTSLRRDLEQQVQQRAASITQGLEFATEGLIEVRETALLGRIVQNYATLPTVLEVSVVDPDGIAIAHSQSLETNTRYAEFRPSLSSAVTEAAQMGNEVHLRTKLDGKSVVVEVLPFSGLLFGKSGRRGVAIAIMDLDQMERETWQSFRASMITMAIGTTAILIFLGWLIRKLLLRPLAKLNQAITESNQTASNQIEDFVLPKLPNDEIGFLGANFAAVLGQLKIYKQIEREAADRQYSEISHRYELATQAAKVWVWDWDIQTDEFHLDQKIQDLLGYEDRCLVFHRFDDWLTYVMEEDRGAIEIALRKHMEDDSPEFTCEYRVIKADGNFQWFLSRGQVVRDNAPNSLRAIGTITDIDQRKKIEIELREKNIRLDTVLLDLQDMKYALDRSAVVAITDLKGTITYVNEKFCEVSQYSQAELIGQNHRILNSGYHNPEFFVEMWRAITNGENWRSDIRNYNKDGSLYWSDTTIVPLLDLHDKPYQFLAISHDITNRKRTEQEMRSLTERLESNNRELQDFAYVSSHDLQEPLRKIQAFGDRLKTTNGDVLNEKGKDYLERMLNAARRAQVLINDLLAFSRITTKAQSFAKIKLSEVLEGVLSDLEIQIEKAGGTVEFDHLPAIEADPIQMRQIFQNLISNAFKFRKENVDPIVEIRVKPIELEQRNFYEIRVSDNGIGLEQKYSDRIFQMFQRLHGRNTYEGTGIGLAICRKIAERHGGTINVESKLDEGATFIITLPLKQLTIENYV